MTTQSTERAVKRVKLAVAALLLLVLGSALAGCVGPGLEPPGRPGMTGGQDNSGNGAAGSASGLPTSHQDGGSTGLSGNGGAGGTAAGAAGTGGDTPSSDAGVVDGGSDDAGTTH